MERIGEAVREIVKTNSGTLAIVALHRNPIVRETLVPQLSLDQNIRLIEPPDYAPFIKLLQKATLVLTDSGGVQEEAPSLGKPVFGPARNDRTPRRSPGRDGTARRHRHPADRCRSHASAFGLKCLRRHGPTPRRPTATATPAAPHRRCAAADREFVVISPPYATSRRDPGSRPEQWFGQFWKLLVRLALIAFSGYFLWRVRSTLTDVIVAAIVAFALVGPVNALVSGPRQTPGDCGRNGLLATLLVFLAFGALLFPERLAHVVPRFVPRPSA